MYVRWLMLIALMASMPGALAHAQEADADDAPAASAESETAAEVDSEEAIAEAEEEAAADGHSEHGHTDAHAAEGHAAAGHAGASSPDPLVFDPDLAIATLVVFIALVTLLRVLAWDPIVKGLQAREDGISDNISAAEAKHDEAKQLLAEHEAKIAAATDQVKGMLDEARRDADATKAAIVAEAQAAADAERKRAVRDVELARDDAMKSLAEQSANLAVDLAGKIVKKEISSDRQSEMIREAIGRLGSAPANNN